MPGHAAPTRLANEEVVAQLRTVAQRVYGFGFAQRMLCRRMEAARSSVAVCTLLVCTSRVRIQAW